MVVTLPTLPNELVEACVDGSMYLCVKIASASKSLRFKLQHLFADGLRLVIDTAEHAWQVEKQLPGSFRVRELVH